MVDLPATESFSAFALRLGCKPSYITELKKAGRLVLTDDGKAVRVAASLARVSGTASPDKSGVADRHAKVRGAAMQTSAPDTEADPDGEPAGAAGSDADGNRYQRARAANEQYKALQSKLDYEERIGKLVDGAQVRAAGAEMGTVIRRRLESLPTLISAQISEADRDHVFALVTDQVQQTLTDLARTFDRATARKEPA